MKESYVQLLVHLDASPQATRRLQVARRIAQGHGAAVNALYAVTPSMVDIPFSPDGGAAVAASLREIDEQRRTQARKAFDESLTSLEVRPNWAETTS